MYEQKEPYSDEEVENILKEALKLSGGTHGYARHPKTFRLLLDLMLENRQLKGRRAALVLVAVEKRGRGSGRVRMKVMRDFKVSSILPFLVQNVSPGSTIDTDGLKSFEGLTEAGFKHIARPQPLRSELQSATVTQA